MQRTSKNFDWFLACLFTLLVIALLILLVRAGFASWLFFLVPFWLAAAFFSFYFWFRFADPGIKFSDAISFWVNSFGNLWGNFSTVLVVKAGDLQGDYFLLKNKPQRGILYISPDSAAALQTRDGRLVILKPGFHTLKSGQEIRLCFNLRYQRLTIGPLEDENPFNRKKSGESFTNYHARQLRAQKVKSYTKDAREVYPSFQIGYQLVSAPITGKPADEDRLLEISQYLSKMGKSGNAAPILDEFIGRRLLDLWCASISELTVDGLFRDCALNRLMTALNESGSIAGKAAASGMHPSPAFPMNVPADELKIPFLRISLNQIWVQSGNHRQAEGAG